MVVVVRLSKYFKYSHTMEKKTKICLIVAFVIGVVLLILGCVLGFVVFPNEVEKQIKEVSFLC